MRSLLSARDPTYRHEPLATLGDSLALFRVSTSASGYVGGTFDVGAYEREEIALIEVDAHGRRRRASLRRRPAGRRRRAACTSATPTSSPTAPRATAPRRRRARSRRCWWDRSTPIATPRRHAPAIEVVDHRILGIWSARGAEALLQRQPLPARGRRRHRPPRRRHPRPAARRAPRAPDDSGHRSRQRRRLREAVLSCSWSSEPMAS